MTNRRDFLQQTGLAASAALMATAGLPSRTAHAADDPLPGKTPHTKFAVNVEMWWTKLPFLERIRQTAALGFPAIEFWSLTGPGKNVAEIAALTQELGLAVAQFTAWGFKPGLNELKNHQAFDKAIETAIEAARLLKCPMATVVAGDDVPGMTQAEMHANVITALKRVAPKVEAANLMLILEPMNLRVDHKGHCLAGSAPAIRICQEVGSSHVKINWDLYHMQISEGDLCGHLREGFQSGTIGYLQLADHPGRHEPGTGEICYNRVLKEAYDLGYRYYVGLECVPTEEHQAAKRVAAADLWD